MPSTLTAGGKDGKRSKKIERNTRKSQFSAILLFCMAFMLQMLARGLSDAQSKAAADEAVQRGYS